MLRDDAQKIATAIEEKMKTEAGGDPQVRATVHAQELSPRSVPAGAGRPTFVNYYIHVEDESRRAVMHMGLAGNLLDEIEPSWDADRLFDAIREREIPVEQLEDAE